MRCDRQQDGRPITKSHALKQSHLTIKVPNIVRCDSSFIAVVRFVANFSAAFEKVHGVSFPVARMVGIVNYIVFSNCLTDNSSRNYQSCIQVAKFSHQQPNTRNIISGICREGKELENSESHPSRTEPCFCRKQRKYRFSSMSQSCRFNIRRTANRRFYALSFSKYGSFHLR